MLVKALIYPLREGPGLLLSNALISSLVPDYFASLRRGAETHAITVVGVIVVHVAVVVHITEISVVARISRTQPPVRKRRRSEHGNHTDQNPKFSVLFLFQNLCA